MLELCPLGHQHHSIAVDNLSQALKTHITQCSSIDDLDESIQHGHEAISLCSEGHSGCDIYLINLAISLLSHFNY
ncbi:hypothetical protein EDB19DRAFT_1633116 [Suillus lakei]|nr:hypothetical protein EDB19DRAFT_1633116 [Suillus lakei]